MRKHNSHFLPNIFKMSISVMMNIRDIELTGTGSYKIPFRKLEGIKPLQIFWGRSVFSLQFNSSRRNGLLLWDVNQMAQDKLYMLTVVNKTLKLRFHGTSTNILYCLSSNMLHCLIRNVLYCLTAITLYSLSANLFHYLNTNMLYCLSTNML